MTPLRTTSLSLLILPATVSAAPQPSPAPQHREYVEVTATRVPEPVDEVPASVTVVSDTEMRDRGATDLRDALAFVQGVDISPGGDQGPAASVPELWGLRELDAFLLVVDGVPWGGAFNPALGTLDLHDVERVEVLRGAAPVMYGATSFVGVIQVVRKAPADTPREAASSFGRFGSGSARVTSSLGKWAGFASALSLDAERRGYADERTRFDRGHVLWRNSRALRAGVFRFDVDGTWLDQDPASPHPREGPSLSAAVPLDANHNPAGARLDERRVFLSTGYDRPLRSTTWSTAVALTRSTQDARRGFLVEPSDAPRNARGLRGDVEVTDLYFDSHVAWTARRPIKVVAGIDHLHGEGRAEGGTFEYTARLDGRDPATPPAAEGDVRIEDRRDFWGAYGFVEWNASPAWRFETGARLNRTAETREGDAGERTNGPEAGEERDDVRLSGLAGVTWTPWRRGADVFHAYANVRDTFKPAAAELNLGEEEAGGGGILEPETAKSYEIGVKARTMGGRMSVEVGSFWMDFRNLVVARSVAGLPGLVNAGSERFKGIEAGLAWDAGEALTVRATYALHDARFLDFVMDFDGVPTQLAGRRFEMSAHHLAGIGATHAPGHGLVAHAEARYNGSRFLNKRNTALAEGFVTIDAGLGWRAARLEVRAEGRNLTDRRDPIAEKRDRGRPVLSDAGAADRCNREGGLLIDADLVDPDAPRRPGPDRALVEHEHQRPHLVEIELSVRLRVDRAEARERDGDATPLGARLDRRKPPLGAFVGGRGVLVAHLHPDPVGTVAADGEDEAVAPGEVARPAVDEGAEDVGVLAGGLAEGEVEERRALAIDPSPGVQEWLAKLRRAVARGREDRPGVEGIDGQGGRGSRRLRRPGRRLGPLRGRRAIGDGDRIGDHPGDIPAIEADLRAIDAGTRGLEGRRSLPIGGGLAVLQDHHARARGHPAADPEPQPGPRRDGVAHRPALAAGLGQEGNAIGRGEGIDPDVAAAAREGLHDGPAIGLVVAGQRPVEQHVVAGEAEDGRVGRERDRHLARHRRALMGVGSHQPRHRTPAEHGVPAGQRVRGVGQAADERVRRVERIGRGHAEEPGPSRRAPLAVAVQQLDPPRPGQVPARPPEVGARAHRMRREGEAPKVANVLEPIGRVAGEAEDGIGDAEGQDVPRGRRQLGADDHEHTVAVALVRLGVQRVVVGDRNEPEARRLGRGHDVHGRAAAVGKARMDVDGAADPLVAVGGGRALEGIGPPQRHPRTPEAGKDRDGLYGPRPDRPPFQRGAVSAARRPATRPPCPSAPR